eukprot:8447288-Karenia_brevis.AAC.1
MAEAHLEPFEPVECSPKHEGPSPMSVPSTVASSTRSGTPSGTPSGESQSSGVPEAPESQNTFQ